MDLKPKCLSAIQKAARGEDSEDTQKAICLILDDYALEDLYEILLRNGLALPMKGQHWLTKKLMLAMFRGEIYCPKFTDLKPRPCPKPPTRTVLVEELNKEIE